MITKQSIDPVKVIEAASSGDKALKLVFDYLAHRQRGRQSINITRVSKNLEKSTLEASAKDIESSFKKLEELDLGRIIYGRNGRDNRFQFDINPVSIGKLAKGNGHLEALKPRSKPLPAIYPIKVNAGDGRVTFPTKITVKYGNLEISGPITEVENAFSILRSLTG
jgi:hypothetical protein